MSSSVVRYVMATRHAELVHRLGGAACVVPVPSGHHEELLEVGSLAGLPVWSMTGSTATALHRARQLARHGALGLLLAENSTDQRLTLCVTLAPVQPACITNVSDDHQLVRRLRRAALRDDHALGGAIALAEALDLDAAGRETFRLLHGLIGRAMALLPAHVPLDDRRAWSLTQLTRLLFLRFVESEGWLAGNSRFLADQFERCLRARRDPTVHLLHPLFFGTLNKPADSRSRLAQGFGAIPFLNGGLFEPHPIERRWSMRLPVDYWRDAFAAIIDRVDVSLDHQCDDGRVTPELLGRVFEGVMDGDERRREGAFFTPPELVEAITREALACHLAARLERTEEGVHQQLDDPDPQLRAAMLDIRVLDPAAGSGAFLVGALALLHGPGAREPRRINHLVTSRLFGVDRHPGAVRLAELRLWLEVLRSQRQSSIAELPPLPNLDTSIRAGDALIDPVLARGIARPVARQVGALQAALGASHGQEKRLAARALAEAELSVVLDSVRSHEQRLDERIGQLLAAARPPTLFDDRPRLERGTLQTLRLLRAERAMARMERRRLARQASSGAFAMAVAFAPVLTDRGGFDLVIGNPPWVRAERLPRELRQQLSARYRWWRSGDGRGWRHLPDLSVAFVERSAQLLRPNGTMALLVPAKLATAGYGTAMRAAMVNHFTLHRVADLGDDPRAGFEATTYPLAMVATRREAPRQQMVRLTLAPGAPQLLQSSWQDRPVWSVGSPDAQAVAAHLAGRHPSLSDQVAPQLGVKTGANAIFLNPPESLARYCRQAVRGRDVRPFRAIPGGMLLWPAGARGEPWDRLPAALAAYFTSARARLQLRTDLHGARWWQLFRTTAATAPHRVIWCDLAPALRAAALPDPAMVPLNSCYVAAVATAVAADALAAWLNSTWISALARLVAEAASGGCARFGARAVGSVPLPPAVLTDLVLAGFTRASTQHDVRSTLDQHVAALLGLEASDCQRLLGKRS